MRVQIDGELAAGVTSKDVMLHVIGKIGTAGGTGSVIEFCGTAVEKMSMEARMSMANMSIEGGARAGMFAPDETTFAYLKGKPLAPKGAEWDQAVEFWKSLRSDEGAHYDKTVKIDAADIPPTVTWGTSPEDTVSIDGTVPDPAKAADEAAKGKIERALTYMGLEPNQRIQDIQITNVRPPAARVASRRGSPNARASPSRTGLHRLVHQLAYRGSAGSCFDRPGS